VGQTAPDPHNSVHNRITNQLSANWSEDLEEFHEESTRDHPIEVLTRQTVLSLLNALTATATIVEVGCSTGYLLDDLRAAYPSAKLAGFDLIPSGLHKAHATMPDCLVAQADACELPLADGCADAVISVNLLEHVHDDVRALSEIQRVLRPGAAAVLVVPTGPGLYDYYDRFLHHERRYARGEMAEKVRSVGLGVEADLHLGSVVFPAFWALKKRNRRRFDHLAGYELEDRVRRDYGGTKDSSLFSAACSFERGLLRHGIHLPFGIRGLTVVRRPIADKPA
jgi:SAM-dependent methyltransferase